MQIKKVINIEDNVLKHCNIKKELERFGVNEVIWAKNAESGISEIEKAISMDQKYDLLVLDMQFEFYGKEDLEAGIKTMKTLRDKEINIPIIFCSSQNWSIPGSIDSVFYNERRSWEDDLKKAMDILRRE